MLSSRFSSRRMWALALPLLLVACGQSAAPGAGPKGAPGGAMPPTEVGVLTVQTQPIALERTLQGRVDAARSAQVRARVTGIVQKRLFAEGSTVKAGQPLFQIDDATYRATLDSAQASLKKAQATRAQAASLVQRYTPLAAAKAISEQDFTTAKTSLAQADADVQSAAAAVRAAKLNVDLARVTAPISGHIGQALVTEGALVSQTEATQLALIQQTNPVYVVLSQSASEVLALRRQAQSGQVMRDGGSTPVTLRLEDGSEYPQKGRLLFSDLNVDATTGQVQIKVEVPNPDGLLMPGMFVQAVLSQARVPSGVLLPQQAVTRNAQGSTVLLVGADGKVASGPVTVEGSQKGQWVISGGLKTGDHVIVEGLQKTAPGATVKPVPWQAPGSPATAPAAAGAGAAGTSGQSGATAS
ncbi:efflux RND transporter periplasmic adaptor subunit [Amphibiibacter pelophylacis]|uniref:Efflux RND transporter periplasmic adaptor subunit n=1 Tax=Amphibiibacter pelophylacis TaxID=1799477 RepID=A0ACC6P2G6_9BURK